MARTAVSGRTRGGTSLAPGTTTGRVNVPSTSSIDLTATFSISLWAKQTAHGYLLYKDGETASGFGISTQGVYFAVTNVVLVNINNSVKNSNTEAISLGSWYHLVVTYDATNVRIYINGALNRTIASSAPATNASDLVIGNKVASNGLNGKIDNVRIYKGRVLTLTEVQTLYLGKSPLDTSLSGFWKFDETSGTVAIDSSANGNNGTITNSTRSTDIPLPLTEPFRRPYIKSYGTSLLFDGVNDLVDVGSGSSIRSSTITLFARVKNAAGSAPRVILGYATAGFSFRINSSDQVELLKAGVISIGTSTGVLDKKYHSVAVTYDASGNYVFYIDGVYSGSGTNLQTITFTGNCQLGVSAGGEWFKGNIDDVQYYNAVLTPADILDLHYGKDPTASSLKGWWKFNEGSGSSATDSSGNGNTGTITQATYSNDVMFKPRTAKSGRISINGFSATGGDITDSGGYRIHTFNSSGTFTANNAGNVDVLTVGGGGGGGGPAGRGGGGGAGEYEYQTNFAVTAQAYSVTVGAGGAGSTAGSTKGVNGSNSVFSTITALGGGGGGTGPGANKDGANGGNGGGGGDHTGAGAAGTGSPGNNGGVGFEAAPSYGAGGGGGAGAVGADGSSTAGGAGGVGISNSITGSAVFYAGGGGGASADAGTTYGAGGNGGGGHGASASVGATAGTANTGGGGGGGNDSGGGNGADGGSGVVIIRYPIG